MANVRSAYAEVQTAVLTKSTQADLTKENNDYIRSLLLTNSHLLPEFQQKNALKLLHHLDIWCCLWEHHQEKLNPNADTTFVFDNTVNFPKTEVNDLLIYSQSLET